MNEGMGLNNQQENSLLEWKSPAFVKYSRGFLWFLFSGIVYLAVVGYSIYVKDWYTIGIATVLLAFLYWYQAKKPALSNFRATQLGIYVDDRFYPYAEIHSYWLLLKSEPKKLNIIFRKHYLPQLSIIIGDVDPLEIRTNLAKFIPEQTDRTESFADKLSRLLRI
jgi:hypothetical protein